MDLQVAAGAFAQIVGLIADFATSRGRRDRLEINEFLNWLGHGHGHLRAMIESSHATSVGVKAALAEGSTKILERIESMERMLAAASVSQGPFQQVAMSLIPERLLSPQQLAILGAYETMQAGRALKLEHLEGSSLIFLDGEGSGGYDPDEPRFFEADLSELVDLRLLKVSYNDNGDPIYQFTRPGQEIAKATCTFTEDKSMLDH